MFGSEPGQERRQGVMNQHVVTKLEAREIDYYVLHTRGESAISVLITALQSDAKRKKMEPEVAEQWLSSLVKAIITEVPYITAKQYERVKETAVVPWGRSDGEATLESLVSAAKASCVLGYVKVPSNDE